MGASDIGASFWAGMTTLGPPATPPARRLSEGPPASGGACPTERPPGAQGVANGLPLPGWG
eukprot:10207539-Alexandrium_andersonii.AAC.1